MNFIISYKPGSHVDEMEVVNHGIERCKPENIVRQWRVKKNNNGISGFVIFFEDGQVYDSFLLSDHGERTGWRDRLQAKRLGIDHDYILNENMAQYERRLEYLEKKNAKGKDIS